MKINGNILATGIETVLYAVCDNENRKNICHVNLLYKGGDRFEIHATDGHRLEIANVPVATEGPAFAFEAMVTPKECETIIKESKKDIEVEITRDGNTLHVSCLSDPIELDPELGVYPDIHSVLPKLAKCKVLECNVDNLRECLGHVKALPWKDVKRTKQEVREKDYTMHAPQFVLRPCAGGVKLEAKTRDGNEVETLLECRHTFGPKFRIKLNATYMVEMLKKVPEGESITLFFEGALSPMVFSYGISVALLMPIRPD